MGVTEARGRVLVAVGLASAALLANGLSAYLLADTAPYLGPTRLLSLPLTGTAYALVVAVAVVASRSWSARRLADVVSLVLVAVGLAAPGLSVGLAQHSWAWVAVGGLDALVVPAVGWICLVSLRGDGSGQGARRLILGAGAVALGAALVQLVSFDPVAWGWCQCIGNPFAVTSGPDAYERVEPWLTGAHLATMAIVLAAVGLGAVRRPGRRAMPEVVLVAGLLTAVGAWTRTDLASLAGEPTDDTGVVVAAGLMAVLAVHLAGLVRRRPSRAHVADLLLAARERSDPARLRELVARAVGDPAAAVYWWDRDAGMFLDHLGRPVGPIGADVPATHVLKVESDRRPIALVVTQRALVQDPGILEPVAEALRLSTENRLLQAELAESLVQVRESRVRILNASDDARRRIERDLHDGAQQLLISTGAKLNLASTRVDPDHDRELAATLAEASDELGRALTELRSLASGITPTALVHGSLPDALEDLALRCPVSTSLRVAGSTDVGQEVASTLYFVVAECLANVAKHSGASSARVDVELGDAARVSVRDDGRGGADPSAGSGLRGLVDRVEAHGGDLDVSSSDAGTTVIVTVPVPTPGGAG